MIYGNNFNNNLRGKISVPMAESGNDGLTPYIKNGNWWIGDDDTGVKAEGRDGKDGLTPTIGYNGNWWIGNDDTGVSASCSGNVDTDALVSAVIAALPKATVYDGTVIITDNAGGGTTDPDVPTEPDVPTTIGFTVGGVSYTADPGMTFEAFILSAYNINSIFIKGEETMAGSKVLYNGKTLCLGEDAVLTSETIIEGGTYVLAPTFNFSVHGVTYSAEVGMTWRQFIDSVYNTDGIGYDETMGAVMAGNEVIVDQSCAGVPIDGAIIEGYDYIYSSEYVAPTISFTVDGETFTAERGSTWAAFIVSEHNESGAFTKGEEVTPTELISFTIDEQSYQAESGMTWQKWITSTYNTGGFVAYDNGVFNSSRDRYIDGVTITDTIRSDATYTVLDY